MIRNTALLLLLTLTGTPVAAAACLGSCGEAEAAGSQTRCHGHQTTETDGARLTATHVCGLPLLDTPTAVAIPHRALHEPVRDEMFLPAPLSGLVEPLAGADSSAVPAKNSPPGSHTFHLILRI